MVLEDLVKQFSKYICVGGTATLIDWVLFYLLAIKLMIYYQIALVISFLTATIVHYILSKGFTFKSKSKRLVKQFTLFFMVSIVALLTSMLIMFFLVEVFLVHKMVSRVMTTGLSLIGGYLAHKNITFNKRFFD